MRAKANDGMSLSAAFIVISLLSVVLIANYGFQSACACQCAGSPVDILSQRSDVIFLGKITSKVWAAPPDVGSYVTFEVLRAWKGVDTKKITIHTGDGSSCGSCPFRRDNPERLEYLVYGTSNFSEILVTLCSGTISRDVSGVDLNKNPFMNVDTSMEYLDDNFMPIELREGHTRSVNLLPPLEILAGLLVVAVFPFIVIRRR